MNYFHYIFYLGIVYVVFSLIWFFIAQLPKYLLRGGRADQPWESYLLKSIQYYFIASLTLLKATEFVEDKSITGEKEIYFYIVGAVILYLYLLGKFERGKQWVFIRAGFSMMRNGQLNAPKSSFLKYEPHLIGLIVLFYLVALQYPVLVTHSLNFWFLESINDFYDTIIIKWILGIIGFVFMLGMIIKGITTTGELVQTIVGVVTGKPYVKKQPKNPFQNMGQHPFGGNPFQQTTNEEQVDIDDETYVDFEYIEEDDEKSDEDTKKNDSK
jgi:hypothetical protein